MGHGRRNTLQGCEGCARRVRRCRESTAKPCCLLCAGYGVRQDVQLIVSSSQSKLKTRATSENATISHCESLRLFSLDPGATTPALHTPYDTAPHTTPPIAMRSTAPCASTAPRRRASNYARNAQPETTHVLVMQRYARHETGSICLVEQAALQLVTKRTKHHAGVQLGRHEALAREW